MAVSPWVVVKFGGTSVSTLKNWQYIRQIINNHLELGDRVLLVCSALTQMSNTLEKLIDAACMGKPEVILTDLKNAHLRLAIELNLDAEQICGELYHDLAQLAQGIALLKEASPKSQAKMMAFGELLLTKLGHAYLRQHDFSVQWLDARDHLQSKRDPLTSSYQNYLSAVCDVEANPNFANALAAQGRLFVTQGYIARNDKQETVVLGRGGSDTSAAYFSVMLDAKACEIWTDVPGVYSANPHLIPEARLLKELDYDEVQEIASMGAKVLHPNCIGPLKRAQIPLYVRCTYLPSHPGSKISLKGESNGLLIKSILTKYQITLLSIDAVSMWKQIGYLADIFACFKQHGFSVDLISTSQSTVTLSLDNNGDLADLDKMQALLGSLAVFGKIQIIGPCASVSVVGRNIRGILPQLSSVFEVFLEQQIYLLSQAANDLNLTFVVAQDQAERLAKNIHALLIENNPLSYYYSKTWQEQFSEEKVRVVPWWQAKAAACLKIAAQTSPCYLYDQNTCAQAAKSLLNCKAIDRVFYAMKANANADILKIFYKEGLGFECVSIFEVEKIFNLFPEISPERILFTPNFAPKAEYARALERGVHVTIDGMHPLAEWGELFVNQSVLLRIDPGEGRGHHKYVCTGGNESKFGISQENLNEVKALVEKQQIKIIGLHAHHGSGILQADLWQHTAKILTGILDHFPGIKYINLGGGLGVVERPGQLPLNLQVFDASIAAIKKAYPHLEMWLEPGRYLVANAGVILARVTQLKAKGHTRFVGIDTGMNSLIRPSLYGSYHEIVNLSKLDQPIAMMAHVVGPICESGDTLGFSRFLPETAEGDILLIANTGAYGYSMSSQYNLRPPAEEFFC